MQSLLVFLAVAALSILASSRRLIEAGRVFQLAQLSASGLTFLALGALIGPHAGGLLLLDDLVRLRPLLALGLGVGGLLVGLNLDLRLLRRLPGRVYVAALAHSGLAFVWVTVPLAGLLVASANVPLRPAFGAASLLGAAASVSSGHLAVLWYRSGRLDRARGLAVSLLTTLDDLTGVTVLAIALAFGAGTALSSGLSLVALAIGLGLSCGALIAFLLHGTPKGPELTAILLGAVALASGAAAYLRVSTLIVGLCCGAMLALVGGDRVEQTYRALVRVERPVYLVLVFLIGAHLDATHPLSWAIVPVFVGFRFFGKILGGLLATRVSAGALTLPPRVGYALLAQGGVGLCALTDYLLLVPGPGSQLAFSVGVMSALVNEVIASRGFRESLVAAAVEQPT